MSDFDRLKIFTGNSNIELAEKIAKKIGIPIGKSVVGRFSDGEIEVELHENVRGKDVFVIQSTSFPTNDNLMELLFLVDSLKRSSAARITAVIPYFGYSRQDRRARSMRVPISAKVVANLVSSVGTGRVLTIDLHSDQEQGFFDIPVDNIYASPILVSDIWKKKINNLTIVSPDTGGVVRARAIAKQLDTDRFAIVDKKREKANESEVMNVIGDVSDSTCVIVDDMVDTAGTLSKASVALKEKGAKYDPNLKLWYLPPVKDPLDVEKFWSFLENTYEDRVQLKRMGAKFHSKIKKWFVPDTCKHSFVEFAKWWPENLKRFLLLSKYRIFRKEISSGQATVYQLLAHC